MITFSSTITFKSNEDNRDQRIIKEGIREKKFQNRSGKQVMSLVLFMGKKRIFIFMLMKIVLKILFIHPEAHLVNLILDDKEYRAVLKDMQFHPVSDKILHADFIESLIINLL